MATKIKSPAYSLKGVGKKVLIGALYSMLAGLVVFLQQNVPSMDFGAYTPFVVALAPFLANLISNFIKEDK